MDSLLELFIHVDDLCKAFFPSWPQQLLAKGTRQCQRDRSLSLSEIMIILIAFHQSPYRDFKAYYDQQVLAHWRSEFLGLVRYNLRKRAIVESVIDQLKNISQIEHSRHRGVNNFLVNLLCGLIAYARQPKKPSLGREMLACLPA